jgi:hypothetical protein
MKIVINSFINNNIAVLHLLENLQKCDEYLEYDIIIVIGGYYCLENYEISIEKNITYIKCNHNSIDYTGLITLMELYSNIDEYYLYLHDTCNVGKNFYKKLKLINLTNVSSIRINRPVSMNIGIYSTNIINKFKYFLLSKKNMNSDNSFFFKCNGQEDYIFNNDNNNIVLDNYEGHIYTGPTDYYNTGTMRIVEYYPNLDIYKIKANYGKITTLAL